MPLRILKNNLIKMKIAYAAFLEGMDVRSYIRYKFWQSALERLEVLKDRTAKVVEQDAKQREEVEDDVRENETDGMRKTLEEFKVKRKGTVTSESRGVMNEKMDFRRLITSVKKKEEEIIMD